MASRPHLHVAAIFALVWVCSELTGLRWERMRYTVKGFEIRSENAAKPASSAGRWLLEWIAKLDCRNSGLDLGCGKLRYTIPLSRRVKSVVAVDSQVQVDRVQTLSGTKSSVRRYATDNLPNVRVYSLNEDGWRRRSYDVVLCSNVISAIPTRKARAELVSIAHERLRHRGIFMLTTQFRNSYFSSWASDPLAIPHCDGFLVRGKKNASFYALLDSDALVKICCQQGFSIIHSGHSKELAFVLATRLR